MIVAALLGAGTTPVSSAGPVLASSGSHEAAHDHAASRVAANRVAANRVAAGR
ncbi:MAG TPA: hypothetical protein VKD66_14500 [Streptosporangiaceae bacterium]|nr:hypothetical protein [Streptosporangiaceae bacterium]